MIRLHVCQVWNLKIVDEQGETTEKLVMFPVNNNPSLSSAGGGHWSLLAASREMNEMKWRWRHYDSAGGMNSEPAKELAAALQRFFQKNGSASALDFADVSGCPEQQNSHDCGLHVLKTAWVSNSANDFELHDC